MMVMYNIQYDENAVDFDKIAIYRYFVDLFMYIFFFVSVGIGPLENYGTQL